jgi:ankyrin repeat protein
LRQFAARAYELEGGPRAAGDLAIAAQLVVSGSSSKCLNHVSVCTGDSPLCSAAGRGDALQIQLLLDARCAVDMPNSLGDMPLSVAAACGHADCAALLINYSADLWAQSGPFHERPLVSACRHGHVQVLELLWQQSASSTPPVLAGCVDAMSPDALWWEKSGDAAQCLLAAGRRGHVEVLRRLCDLMDVTPGAAPQGVRVLRDAVDKEGRNILFVAAMNGFGEVIKFVCQTLAENHLLCCLHATDLRGRTPLMVGAERGHVSVVDYLSASGGQELLVRTTETHWNCMLKAAQFGHLSVVRLLAERGGPQLLFQTDLRGWSCLHLAAFWGQTEVVEFLLERGGSKLCCLHNVSGNTALWGAVTKGHLSIVERLCDTGGPQVLGDVPALRRAFANACANGFDDAALAVQSRFKEQLIQPDSEQNLLVTG